VGQGVFQFRVKAVNKEGESDPLTTETAILAKNPYGVPAKVEKPTLVDWDKDHVDLEWIAPNDGGAPIKNYIIEKKTKHGRWEQALQVPATGKTAATVPGLTQGEEYQFRITAVNKAGPGEPSDPSDRVIAKPRFRKSVMIDKTAFSGTTHSPRGYSRYRIASRRVDQVQR
jgi:predicted phage tail protein